MATDWALRRSRAPRSERDRTLWAWYFVSGLIVVTGYYSLARAGLGQAIVIDAINFFAVVATSVAAARTQGSTRSVWLALTAAMLLSTAANVAYYSYPLATGRALPFPSAADVSWLAMYPFFAIALWALARRRRKTERLGDALDAAILAISAAALTWQFLIVPTLSTPMHVVARLVSVGYPAMDVLIVALLARFVVAGGWKNGAIGMLTGSFVALVLADSVYMVEFAHGGYQYGGASDGLWMLSYVLIGTAALHPHAADLFERRTRSSKRMSAERILFLSMSVLTGPLIMLVRPADRIFAAVVSVVSFTLVMARVTDLNRQLARAGVQLERRATTDTLTGLRNRAAFYDSAARRVAAVDGPVAVLFIDLDDFKDVNDRLGHGCGDALLVAVAERLQRIVRPDDLLARLGGDEFAVLLQDLAGESVATKVGERMVSALSQPLRLAESTVQVSASVGVAFQVARTDVDELLRQADLAMYRAKHNGKDRVEVYDDELERDADESSRLSADILDAVRRDELVVDYQPLVDLHTRSLIGVEALVRWRHPTRGLLLPGTFIPVAESTGAILHIDEAVLLKAGQQVRYWQARYERPDLCLSVNVSARQVELPDFATAIESALRKTGLSPASLLVEVTESVLVNPIGTAAENLTALRNLGARVAIDDFGTGYSSLGYLRRLPVDILKVDQTFVASAPDDAQSTAILDGIVTLGRRLDLEVIPEGIESVAQLDLLKRLGCTIGQGFLLGRPASAAEIEDRIGCETSVRTPHHDAGHPRPAVELASS